MKFEKGDRVEIQPASDDGPQWEACRGLRATVLRVLRGRRMDSDYWIHIKIDGCDDTYCDPADLRKLGILELIAEAAR